MDSWWVPLYKLWIWLMRPRTENARRYQALELARNGKILQALAILEELYPGTIDRHMRDLTDREAVHFSSAPERNRKLNASKQVRYQGPASDEEAALAAAANFNNPAEGDPRAQLALAQLLQKQGRHDEAKRMFNSAAMAGYHIGPDSYET